MHILLLLELLLKALLCQESPLYDVQQYQSREGIGDLDEPSGKENHDREQRKALCTLYQCRNHLKRRQFLCRLGDSGGEVEEDDIVDVYDGEEEG